MSSIPQLKGSSKKPSSNIVVARARPPLEHMVAPGGSYMMPTLYLSSQNNGAKGTQLTKCELDTSQQHHSEAVPRYQSFSQAQELAQGERTNTEIHWMLRTDGRHKSLTNPGKSMAGVMRYGIQVGTEDDDGAIGTLEERSD